MYSPASKVGATFLLSHWSFALATAWGFADVLSVPPEVGTTYASELQNQERHRAASFPVESHLAGRELAGTWDMAWRLVRELPQEDWTRWVDRHRS